MCKKNKLYIIGAGSVGGHIAKNISDYSGNFKVAGFYDDDKKKIGTKIFDSPVLGSVSDVLTTENLFIVIGIAYPNVKKVLFERLSENKTLKYPSLIHNKAWISADVFIGEGAVIYPGTSINYGSIIREHVLLNMNCCLGHHTEIGKYSTLAPGVNTGGHTSVGKCVDIGIGVSTIQNIKICSDSLIGGQAFVNKNIPSGSKAMGVPVKIKKSDLNKS